MDPIVVLSLVTIALWLATAGASYLRKERSGASADGWTSVGDSRSRGEQLEVQVNPGKCARFGFCEHEAPDVFRLRGDRLDYKATVPPEQQEAAEWAAKVCPARAIKVNRPGSRMYMPQLSGEEAALR